jgi:hypothetical protein
MIGRPAAAVTYAGSGRRHGAVVVEDRERECLQHHGVGERADDGEDGGAGEVQLALGVAVDVAGELVVGEPVEGAPVDDALQRCELLVAEPEVVDRFQEPPRARHHPVATPVGQPPREHLENTLPGGRAVGERGGDHRQFVPVGQERGGHARRGGTAAHGTGA